MKIKPPCPDGGFDSVIAEIGNKGFKKLKISNSISVLSILFLITILSILPVIFRQSVQLHEA